MNGQDCRHNAFASFPLAQALNSLESKERSLKTVDKVVGREIKEKKEGREDRFIHFSNRLGGLMITLTGLSDGQSDLKVFT